MAALLQALTLVRMQIDRIWRVLGPGLRQRVGRALAAVGAAAGGFRVEAGHLQRVGAGADDGGL